MKKILKYILISCGMLIVVLVDFQSVSADTAYKTFTIDGYGNYISTQTAYTAEGSITITDNTTLSKPSDMKTNQAGNLYVADTGNKRIVILEKDGTIIRSIENEKMMSPSGLAVTDEGKIYVADEAAKAVFVFSEEGELLRTFERPTAISFGEKNTFTPIKVAVDDRENIYVLSKGNSNGIILLNGTTENEFLGYFAPNTAQESPLTSFRKMIFTEEQLDRMLDTAPNSVTNVAVDTKGLVYTVTEGDVKDTLKKLNLGGKNIIKTDIRDQFSSAVTVGPLDNVFMTTTKGYIYELTSEGQLLFVFGGAEAGRQRNGLFGSISAIAVDGNNNLYVLDQEKGEIQTFQTTQFADLVHEALALYQNGYYTESKGPWQEVLQMNSLFEFAHLGMGEAYYKEGDFDAALRSYRLGRDEEGYSNAFWEVRNDWIRENIMMILAIILIWIILHKIGSIIQKKYGLFQTFIDAKRKVTNINILKKIGFTKRFITNPNDGFYGIKYEKKTSNISSIIIFGLLFVIFTLNKYFTGFIFKTVQEGVYTVASDFIVLMSGTILLIICIYLVSTITDGTSTFSQIFQGFAYALTPYLFLKPFVLLISNVITLNEQFLITFTNFIIYTWVLILLFIMIKELNDYNIGETVKTIFLVLFTLFIAVAILFIIYILIRQVVSFLVSIIGEAVYQIGHS